MAELAAKSSTKSVVWDYYRHKHGADGQAVNDGSATCQTCRTHILAKHRNNCNLLAHLKTNHASIYIQSTTRQSQQRMRRARDWPETVCPCLHLLVS